MHVHVLPQACVVIDISSGRLSGRLPEGVELLELSGTGGEREEGVEPLDLPAILGQAVGAYDDVGHVVRFLAGFRASPERLGFSVMRGRKGFN